MRMRKFVAFALAALTALPVYGQPKGRIAQNVLFSDYELDSTTYIYVCAVNRLGHVLGTGVMQPQRVTTVGSSTTVTGVTVAESPFGSVAVGDELLFNLDGVLTWKYVQARASADSITVGPDAINLGDGREGTRGYPFHYFIRTSGAGADQCAIQVSDFRNVTISVAVTQMVATSIDAQVECRLKGSVSTWIIVGSDNFTGVDGTMFLMDPAEYQECRLGLKINTDDGNDLTTNAEKITAVVRGTY